MANVCEYNMIVKGRKSSCYAFFVGQNYYDYKEIDFEDGTDEEYELHFSGTCKWAVDYYCCEYYGICPVKIPDDLENETEVEKWYYKTFQESYSVKSRSEMFDVEVQCNSRDAEGNPETAYYVHYKSGEAFGDNVPEELIFKETVIQKNETMLEAGNSTLADEFVKNGSYKTKLGNTYSIKENKLYLIDSVAIPVNSDWQFKIMTDDDEGEEYLEVTEKMNTNDEDDDIIITFSFPKNETDSELMVSLSDAIGIVNMSLASSFLLMLKGAKTVIIYYTVNYNSKSFSIQSKVDVYNEACLTTMIRMMENFFEKLEFDGKPTKIKRISNSLINNLYSQVFEEDDEEDDDE